MKYITLKLNNEELDTLTQVLAQNIIELKFKKIDNEKEEAHRQYEIIKKQELLYALTFLKR